MMRDRRRIAAHVAAGAWLGGALGTFGTILVRGSDLGWFWRVVAPLLWPLYLGGLPNDPGAWAFTFAGAALGGAAAALLARR